MADRLCAHLTPEAARIWSDDGIFGVSHRDDLDVRKRARALLQHAGGFLSSREAEDYAARHGLLTEAEPEEVFLGDAPAHSRRTLAGLCGLDEPDDVVLAPSGMNAFWSAFQAVAARGRATGRDTWLQVGWLYLDTAAILAKFTGDRHVRVFDVHNRAAIEAALRENGPRLAGIVTEVTTNPQMQTPDLPWLAEQARAHGALMLVDPSIASPYNVDVLPHADLVLNSLTKYAACEGDVIAGAVVVTPRCPDRVALHAAIAAEVEPLHPRDAARLAQEIDSYEQLMPRLSANALAVAAHLLRRKRGVRRLHWCLQEGGRANYLRLARSPGHIAPVLSFEVDGDMARFYDAVPIAKGPSFGMRTSLLCPFIYLAHYDLVTSCDGRRVLDEAKLSPELLRLAVGEEPAGAIIAALEQGFAAAGLA
jgi:cystathionine gamma-synthase